MNQDSTFDILLLIARPAAGKSEEATGVTSGAFIVIRPEAPGDRAGAVDRAG